jgi:hypothetical protein
MKSFLFAGFLSLSCNIYAQDTAQPTGPDMSQVKANMVKEIDERIQILQEAKSCTESAADAAALKNCRRTMHEKMKTDREDNKAKREARRAERRAKKK